MALAHLRNLRNRYIWKRIFYERLTELLHLNLLAVKRETSLAAVFARRPRYTRTMLCAS